MASVTSIAAPGSAAANTATSTAGGIIDIGDPTKMPDHEVTFHDVLSTLNPLQYIPVIGSIYRSITGDEAPQAAQVLGGALLGGPLGLIASAASAVIEQSTGKDAGEQVIAMLFPHGDTPAPQNQNYAANTPNASSTSTSAAPATTATAAATTASTTASAPVAVASAPLPPPQAAAPVAANPPAATPTAAANAATQPAAAPPTPAPAAPPPATTPNTPLLAPAPSKTTSSGYTLADYRMYAGHGVPPSSGANGAQFRNTPVPLQTTIPLPSDVSRTPIVANVTQTPANVAPAAPAAAAAQPEDTWVSQAMMKGLDRYRDMMRQQDQQQSGSQPQQ